jgi:hypothetical protein
MLLKLASVNWAFYPFLLNGEPVQFLTKLTIMFDGKKASAKLKIEHDPLSSSNPESVPKCWKNRNYTNNADCALAVGVIACLQQ